MNELAERLGSMGDLYVTSAAERDYTDALCWYAQHGVELAESFERSVHVALEEIKSAPNRFPLCDQRHRYYMLRRFPYQVIYRIIDDLPWVIAVAHTSRDPRYWASR